MERIALVTSRDYEILHRPLIFRLFPPRYERDLSNGRPVREFVALAKLLREGGFRVHPAPRPLHLGDGEHFDLIKIGKCNIDLDWRLMQQHEDRNLSEWNPRNLETVQYFNDYIDLGRQTWNLSLRSPEGRRRLAELLGEHGRLFVKSVVKGHAAIVTSFDTYLREFGPLDLVDADSLSLLVSEVIPIRTIEAVVQGRRASRTDEWRHYVYKGQRVATSHAFECNQRRTSSECRDQNVSYAEGIIEGLRATDFATSYALDTCTLEDATCTVVEANFFFSSGIYDPAALKAIAAAIIEM